MRALGVLYLALATVASAQAPVVSKTKRLPDPRVQLRSSTGQNFWRPIQPGEVTLFGAIENLGQRLEQDRVLASRGVYRSFNFQYKSFTYEKDFFNIYRGFTLRSFWDGKVDVGLFSHKPARGVLFGPGSNYFRPGASNRYELRFRWNLGERQ